MNTKRREKGLLPIIFNHTKIIKKDNFKDILFYSLNNTNENKIKEDLFSHLFIASTKQGICFLAPTSSIDLGLSELRKQFPKATFIHKKKDKEKKLIEKIKSLKYNQKPIKSPIELHLIGTDFQLKVWKALLSIPYGKSTTYGAITKQIGYKKAYQAIGGAIGNNPISMLIPCHRVIKKDDSIGGYRWGKSIKKELLRIEKEETQKNNIFLLAY